MAKFREQFRVRCREGFVFGFGTGFVFGFGEQVSLKRLRVLGWECLETPIPRNMGFHESKSRPAALSFRFPQQKKTGGLIFA